VAAGTATTMQLPGDCKKSECDGSGAIIATNDNTDVSDDSNPCTTDACSGGIGSHTPVAAGIACGAGQVCDAAGSCVGCVAAATCPGVDDECKTRTCTANVCGFSFTAAGTAVAAQTAADCKKNQCDGAGVIVPVADNTDLPVDNLQCTSDVCTAGAPSNPPTASGSACSQNGGTTCNGTGQCVQCVTASTCPGQDTECQTRTCVASTCGFAFTASGTPTSAQTASNCQKNQCNGAGAIVAVADNTDVPVDGNACTSDVCTAGVPSNPPTASGSACSVGANTTCNGVGQCVQCVTASTCPGTDTECQTRTCLANACGFTFTATGTPTSAQTAGNCQKNQCNGAGAIVTAADDTDVPVDGNLCTTDTCTAGVPSNPPVAAGSSCGSGLVCNATGTCLGCNTGTDCPGTDTECQTRTCVANICGVAFTAAGTATAAQTAGDCKQNECNGAGAIVAANHDTDVPSDAFQCTADTCTAGVPTFTPVASGTACSQAGGTLCDAIGDCVQCNTASDCPGSDTDCHVRTCTAGTCGVFNTASGNPTTAQSTGNCQINQCDGAGNAVNVADNSDVPVDSNQCTGDVCTAGVPSNPNLAVGTVCAQSGGTTCDGSGVCIAAGATCSDGTKNGAETGIDCGGGTCNPCGIGLACGVNSDCTSGNCVGGTCFQNHLVINEVDYDQVATDNAEFVEIYNGTGAAVPLAGYSLVLVNGSNNATYLTLSLASATTLPAGGYLVVATATVVVPPTALKINFALASDNIQNGSPDAVALINTTTSTLVDALSYEGSMTAATVTGLTGTVNLVEGTVLPVATADSNSLPGSLSRLPNGTDLNNAATDWAFTATSTPGVANQ
jgi:hypothetical protein